MEYIQFEKILISKERQERMIDNQIKEMGFIKQAIKNFSRIIQDNIN